MVIVLIETLWNVKEDIQNQILHECKVLIETLWNVKEEKNLLVVFQLEVLIETLWNVKVSITSSYTFSPDSINRNIVECKAIRQ